MNLWRRLLHPWWRPTILVIDVLGIMVCAGCFVFGYSVAWILPLGLINLVRIGLMWREAWVNSDPLRQRPSGTPEEGAPEEHAAEQHAPEER